MKKLTDNQQAAGFIALAIIIAVFLCLTGCTYQVPDNSYIPPEQVPGSPSGTNSNNTLTTEGQPPQEVTWISPGKVNVANFYPGAIAEYPITIHNGNDYQASFSIYYRYPDHTDIEKGYVAPPVETQDWVIVADPTPVLSPFETKEVLVTISMPSSATNYPQQWEFWIGVMDTTQAGMVKTELCTRWLIDMR